eukprot:gene3663-4561_t
MSFNDLLEDILEDEISLVVKELEFYKDPFQRSIDEFLGINLVDYKTNQFLFKADVENSFQRLIFYYMDENMLKSLGVTRPTIQIFELLSTFGANDEDVPNWYKKYGISFYSKAFAQSGKAVFSYRFKKNAVELLDKKMKSYQEENVFKEHYAKLLNYITKTKIPKKYMDFDKKFLLRLEQVMTSKPFYKRYKTKFAVDLDDIGRKSLFTELKVKLDLLEPSGKLSNKILLTYIGSQFTTIMSQLQGNNPNTQKFLKAASTESITQIIKKIQSDPNSEYHGMLKNVLGAVGNVQNLQNKLATIIIEINNRAIKEFTDIGIEMTVFNTNAAVEEATPLLVQNPKYGFSAFMKNPKFLKFVKISVVAFQVSTLFYGVFNWKDMNVVITSSSLFYDIVAFGLRRYSARILAILASKTIVKKVFNFVSLGITGIITKYAPPKVLSFLGKVGTVISVLFLSYSIGDLIANPPKNGIQAAIKALEIGIDLFSLFIACVAASSVSLFIPLVAAAVVIAIVVVVPLISIVNDILNFLEAYDAFDRIWEPISPEYLIPDNEYATLCNGFIDRYTSRYPLPYNERQCYQKYYTHSSIRKLYLIQSDGCMSKPGIQ